MRKRILLITAAVAILLPWIGCATSGNIGEPQKEEEQVAVITTKKGKIVIELYPDAAPVTVDNFKKLIKRKFYDWLTFHRKEDNPRLNIIQGGDPKGNGEGGPGYTIIDEYTNPNQVPHRRGTVAMARGKTPNSAGSQFYICLKAQPHLDGQYTTFGEVIQGMEVVDQLEVGDVMRKIRLEAKSKYVIPK
ncbi:MAG: peptidylprolyl isomerase [Candidatus Poribacteria bacterium]|nr:peptidylprolyl isomerase [Candidatus Poribacteria bacterium]